MKMEVLSVAEDGYESNRFTAAQKDYKYGTVYWRKPNWPVRETTCTELRFSIDINKTLLVRQYEDNKLRITIKFDKLDIEGLIQYLQEVKTFISEEEMVARLLGKM